MKKRLIFDIETDGLYNEATKLWCISILQIGGRSSTPTIYYDGQDFEGQPKAGTISDALRILSEADQLIGHNIIGCDLPILKKLKDFVPKDSCKITDTLVLSRLFNPDRLRHSLAAYGEELGFPKGDYNDWTNLNKEMVIYCKQDVNVTLATYNYLKKTIKGQSWGESIELEHRVATIMAQVEVDGCLFDSEKANSLLDMLHSKVSEIDCEILKVIPLTVKPSGRYVSKPFNRNGTLSARAAKYIGDPTAICVGPFQPIEFEQVNLGSGKQVKGWLTSIGWEPTEFTPGGAGRVTEDSFDSLPDADIGRLLKNRIQYSHRIGQITGWVESVRSDGRICQGAATNGTPTGRMRHVRIVNVPACSLYPKGHEKAGQIHWVDDDSLVQTPFLGADMRSLFKAMQGYEIVGHDASGLELRMLAHYMNDEQYTEILLNGDIHSYNQELAGLHSRTSAKTFIYAFIYGAGDAKLGSIVEGGESEGADLRNRFLRENPKLNKLIRKVQRIARERGYLIGLDGRRVFLRRDSRGRVLEHKALNTLLQSAGAIVMKKSMVLLYDMAIAEGLDFKKVLDMHDEGQAEVLKKDSKRYAELAVQSVVLAGIHFNLNIPLDAEAKIGDNWAETH